MTQKPALTPPANGFTLVEISVALVIIGLLVGGVMAGSNLIRSSEVQSVAAQKEELTRAVMTFRERYNGFPGDLSNAASIWGTVGDTSPASCPNDAGSGTETCNGNGNLLIAESGAQSEGFRAWQHLANAGLLEGSFTGSPGGNAAESYIPGETMPAGRMNASMWFIGYVGSNSGTDFFTGSWGHSLFFAARGGHSVEKITNPLTPEEAWGLDRKYDDGNPARGNIAGINLDTADGVYLIGNCNSAASATDLDAAYKMDHDQKACSLIFANVF